MAIKYTNFILTASIIDVVQEDKNAVNVIQYLCSFLPNMLKLYHNIKFDESQGKLLLSKVNYNTLLDDFTSSLEELKFPRTSTLKRQLKYTSTEQFNEEDFYNNLKDYLKTYKEKFKKFKPDSVREVNKILNIYKAKELKDSHWKYIQEFARNVPNKSIKKYLKSIDTINYDASMNNYSSSRQDKINTNKRLFKTANPTDEQVKALKEKSPEKYKEYRKAILQEKKDAKQALEDTWDARGFNRVEDVRKVKKLLKELKITDPIDDGFEGKVSLGDTPSVLFKYYTKYGKELENVPGSNIRMNPNYDKSDNAYYCIGLPQQNFTGNEYRFYTKDYRRRSLKEKHSSAKKLDEQLDIEAIRNQYTKDYKQIRLLQDGEIPNNKALAALVTAVIDDTAGRIGSNKDSEEQGVYGIHNLLAKFITIKDNDTAILSYTGKKKVKQKHIITNPKIVKALKKLKAIRKPNEHIFSKKGGAPISAGFINNYMKEIGIPFSAHRFRNFHANRIFREVIEQNKDKISKQPMKVFDKAVDAVATKLGHERTNSIKTYIDSDLILDYFDKAGIEPPKIVKKVKQLVNLKENTEE